MRGVTNRVLYKYNTISNFNSHASCEAWHSMPYIKVSVLFISTHTPHARRDWRNLLYCTKTYKFQLTRLMRGVTLEDKSIQEIHKISTHTPHARRDWWSFCIKINSKISTHTPHARRDINFCIWWTFFWRFQLTRLMRGVTSWCRTNVATISISTHTPHARRDLKKCFCLIHMLNFNSHASCEAWLRSQCESNFLRNFNSHASCEAWHDNIILSLGSGKFQLTRLMRGVTRHFQLIMQILGNFNSHASCEAWRWNPRRIILS